MSEIARHERGISVDALLCFSVRLDTPAALSRLRPQAPGPEGPLARADAWQDGDVGRAAELLAACYSPETGQVFASDGQPAQWHRYVSTLVEDEPWGEIDREVTRVVRCGHDLLAAVLVTSMRPGTAHVAQFAVHPDCRRRGMATSLLMAAVGRAAAAGYVEMTLVVAESNRAAARLYARVGFKHCATVTPTPSRGCDGVAVVSIAR